MIEIKITVDQLKNYLGTGLRMEHPSTKGHRWKLHHDEGVLNTISISSALLIEAKPICYRLSDLDKEIEHNWERFVPIEELSKFTTTEINHHGEIESYEFDGNICVTRMPDDMDWYRLQKLFEWHFWPFGDEYFEQGLVIDKRKDGSNV